MKTNVSIVIPVYNEIKSIDRTLNDIYEHMGDSGNSFEVILVDDGSVDGTSQRIASISLPALKIITHATNKGYGAAIKSGLRAAKYELIVLTDADGTYPTQKISELVQATDSNDMVVGARVKDNVSIPTIRKPAKWAINVLAEYLSRRKIPDLNSGLRVLRKSTVERFLNILPDGFSFTTTITLALLANGYKIEYVPIDYYKRAGKSKIRPIRDTLNFIQLVTRTIMYFDPLRVFLPLSLVLFLGSFAGIFYRAITGSGLLVVSVILFVSAIQVLTVGMLADLVDKRNGRLGTISRQMDFRDTAGGHRGERLVATGYSAAAPEFDENPVKQHVGGRGTMDEQADTVQEDLVVGYEAESRVRDQ